MDVSFFIVAAWVIGAGLLGFIISALFAGWLRLSRSRFLIAYVILSGLFTYYFLVQNAIDIRSVLDKNWIWGILFGTIVSTFLVRTVRSQPVSRDFGGGKLVFDLIWSGLIYGLMDAIFLNILPVLAVWVGTSQLAWTGTIWGKIITGVIGLLASLLVTLMYHLGYPEFRNRRVSLVLVGNSLITLAFLLSSNPFGSIISHTAMHLSAVLQGAETTIQLPPHYRGYSEFTQDESLITQ